MKKLILFLVLATTPFVMEKMEGNQKQATPSVFTLSQKMRDAIITQIAREQYSSNLYLSYASYFADIGLDGCEAFFKEQASEEAEHALLFYTHLLDRNERFNLNAVDASITLPTSPTDAFYKLYENEKEVSKSILNLFTMAVDEKDYATQVFLHSFLTLQVEEERDAEGFVQMLELAGENDPSAILFLNAKFEEEFND